MTVTVEAPDKRVAPAESPYSDIHWEDLKTEEQEKVGATFDGLAEDQWGQWFDLGTPEWRVKKLQILNVHAEQASDFIAATEAGANLLTKMYDYTGRFVAYPGEASHVAHVLWIAHTHRMDAWDSTPRLAVMSPEPGCGKTRVIEITKPLVPHPLSAANISSASLCRAFTVQDDEPLPTVLIDEIDTVYGRNAKGNEDLRCIIDAGHRADAGQILRSPATKAGIVREYLDTYGAILLAGLGRVPKTIEQRSVVIQMRKPIGSERVEKWHYRVHSAEGEAIRDELAEWMTCIEPGKYPELPPELENRDSDVWEPLIMVADAAGGGWGERARDAAVTFVTGVTGHPRVSLGVLLLSDIRDLFSKESGQTWLSSQTILSHLHSLEVQPWRTFSKGQPMSYRGLSLLLSDYGINSEQVRPDGKSNAVRGYRKEDFLIPWESFLQ